MYNGEMRSKLNKVVINQRLVTDNRSVRMIGDYLGLQKKTLFTDLICGHNWLARPDNVTTHKSGCAECSPTKKLTEQDVIAKLLAKDNGIKLTEPYTTRDATYTFECVAGHKFKSALASVLYSDSCPICVGRYQRTKNELNVELRDRGLTILDEFMVLKDKVRYSCDNGHIGKTTVERLINMRCAHCQRNAPLTENIVKSRLYEKGSTLISPFIRGKMVSIRCALGHEYEIYSAKATSKRCPECRIKGFRYDLPAVGYVIEYNGFIKYGITGDLVVRTRHLKKNGKHLSFFTRNFFTGKEAYDWEKSVKKKFGGSYVDVNTCPDGYTETLPPNKLQKVIKNLKEYK
jgi:hypothetical protein